MAMKLFVNLPVKDLNKSIAFFTKLGFKFNAQFTDEKATCMIVSEESFVMLLVEPYFKTFITKEIPETARYTEVILALSADSREKVDEIFNNAIEAGGAKSLEPQDHGFMYQKSFQDIDGHSWEILWMDPTAINQE